MNPAVMVAIHAAAATEKARTQVLDAFRVKGATAPDRMCTLSDLNLPDDDKVLREFIAAGVIRGVDSRGRLTVLGDSIDRVAGYYLDEPACIAHRSKQRSSSSRQALMAVLALLGASVVAVLIMRLFAGGFPGGE